MKKFLKYVFVLFILSAIAGAGVIAYYGKDDFLLGRSLSSDNLSFSVILTDRNDKELYRMFGDENREWTDFDKIPLSLKKATLLAEDKRFFSHFGVDILGILRATQQNISDGGFSQGGSTITQQLARKVFLTDDKTLKRKFREAMISFGIEMEYSKPEILEMYLNVVPYGPRENGVSVAANYYFQKQPAELTDAESLILAVMPKNPVKLAKETSIATWLGECSENFAGETCNFFTDPEYQKSRLEIVLVKYSELEKWSEDKTIATWEEMKSITLPEKKNWVDADYLHFSFWVKDFLAENDFDISTAKNGIKIKTTLDTALQDDIYNYLRDGVSAELFTKYEIENFAVIVLDNQTRGPLVWIGSKAFWNDNISGQVDILRSPRQSGSSIKPFIYAAAIDQGFQPPTIFYDTALKFQNENHSVQNSDGRFMGGIRMTDALAKSRNIPAIKALLLAGGESGVKTYLDEKFSFKIKENFGDHYFGWTMALGTAPIKVSDLANGYATLATSENKELCPILEITDFHGKKLHNPCKRKTIATINPTTSFFISDILSNEEARPKTNYGWRENLTIPNFNIAAKTGTSTNRVNGKLLPVDNIVAGYSPKATVLMWAGNSEGPFKEGTVAVISIGKIWRTIGEKVFAKYPELHAEFKAPVELKKVHGEWATMDYEPPSYEELSKFLVNSREAYIDPLKDITKQIITKKSTNISPANGFHSNVTEIETEDSAVPAEEIMQPQRKKRVLFKNDYKSFREFRNQRPAVFEFNY